MAIRIRTVDLLWLAFLALGLAVFVRIVILGPGMYISRTPIETPPVTQSEMDAARQGK